MKKLLTKQFFFFCLSGWLFFFTNAQASPLDSLIKHDALPASAIAPAASGDVLSRIQNRLQQTQARLQALKNSKDDVDNDKRRFWLELEIYAYRQHAAAMVGIQALDARKSLNPASAVGDANQQLMLAQLIAQEIDNLSNSIRLQEQHLDTISSELEQAQIEQRQSQDEFEKASPAGRSAAAAQLSLAQLKTESWSASLAAMDARLKFTRARLQVRREHALQLDSLNGEQSRTVEMTAEQQRVKTLQQQYATEQNQLAEAVYSLRQQLAKIKLEQEKVQADLNDAKKAKQHDALKQQLGEFKTQESHILRELETNAIRSGIYSDLMLASTLETSFWKQRIVLQSSEQQAQLQALNDKAKQWIASLQETQQAMQVAAGIAQDQVDRLNLINEADSELIEHWQAREQAYREASTQLRRSELVLQRGLSDNTQKTMGMRAVYWQEKVSNSAENAWNFELFSVDETMNVEGQNVTLSRGVTVGKTVIAILLITAGFALCIAIANLIERQLTHRSQIAPVSIRIAKRWLLTVAFIILLINSLLLVQIPLTAFAFMGGAIAIGLGFGMQTLLKNLISGLMMLLERPFRPGDTIEVAGIRGTIVDMNVRAAVVRDVNGIDTLVPNSTFLEQNVTNWSYTTSIIRQGFQVGVAYGSDLRVVAKLLEEEVGRHGKISKDHTPEVLLEDFAADALTFGVYYWIDIGAGVIGRQVASDLRFMIDASFRKNNICIAFPQRDVHLDIAGPLRVQLETPTPENLESQRPNKGDSTGQ